MPPDCGKYARYLLRLRYRRGMFRRPGLQNDADPPHVRKRQNSRCGKRNCGLGESNAVKLRKVGGNCYLVGDLSSGIAENLPPFSPRVGIAAAVQANTVLSILLEVEP